MKVMPELHAEIVAAILLVQTAIRWKPGKEAAHLLTRKKWQHLPVDATLEDYQTIIQAVIHNHEAFVYLYRHGSRIYPAIVAPVQQKPWLVMFGIDGIMETAFVIESPRSILVSPNLS
ncbi:MAG: hypothetical protein R3E79_23695 [Caldilineaceae bacterium]